MKASIIIVCIILSSCGHSLRAQDTITRDMIYHALVRILSDPSFKCYGALYEVNDSSILISSRRLKDYNSGNVEALRFPIEDVKVIYVDKPGSGGRGALKGAAYGVALGTLFGVLSGGNAVLRRGDAMLGGAVGGFVVGVPTGFIVGKIEGHKRTPINGSMDEFNLNKDKLKDYAIKK